MIIGGDTSRKKLPTKRQAMPIIFAKEDNKGVVFPNNNVAVDFKQNYDVHHILIDNGSSADVLYFDALVKMGVSPQSIDPSGLPFTGDAIQKKG